MLWSRVSPMSALNWVLPKNSNRRYSVSTEQKPPNQQTQKSSTADSVNKITWPVKFSGVAQGVASLLVGEVASYPGFSFRFSVIR